MRCARDKIQQPYSRSFTRLTRARFVPGFHYEKRKQRMFSASNTNRRVNGVVVREEMRAGRSARRKCTAHFLLHLSSAINAARISPKTCSRNFRSTSIVVLRGAVKNTRFAVTRFVERCAKAICRKCVCICYAIDPVCSLSAVELWVANCARTSKQSRTRCALWSAFGPWRQPSVNPITDQG